MNVVTGEVISLTNDCFDPQGNTPAPHEGRVKHGCRGKVS
jgi:hypothetical protein